MIDNKTLEKLEGIKNIFIKEADRQDYGLVFSMENVRTIVACRDLMEKAYSLLKQHEGSEALDMIKRHISPVKEMAFKYHSGSVHLGTGEIRHVIYSDFENVIRFYDATLYDVVEALATAAQSEDGIFLDDSNDLLCVIDGENAFVWSIGYLDYEAEGIEDSYVIEAFQADSFDGMLRPSDQMLKGLREKTERFVAKLNANLSEAA